MNIIAAANRAAWSSTAKRSWIPCAVVSSQGARAEKLVSWSSWTIVGCPVHTDGERSTNGYNICLEVFRQGTIATWKPVWESTMCGTGTASIKIKCIDISWLEGTCSNVGNSLSWRGFRPNFRHFSHESDMFRKICFTASSTSFGYVRPKEDKSWLVERCRNRRCRFCSFCLVKRFPRAFHVKNVCPFLQLISIP